MSLQLTTESMRRSLTRVMSAREPWPPSTLPMCIDLRRSASTEERLLASASSVPRRVVRRRSIG